MLFVESSSEEENMDVSQTPPPGKFAATVKVGPKGQVVIPKAARDLFDIKPGDTLLLLADANQGIALMRQELLDEIVAKAMLGQPGMPPQGGET
nr:AbrB/MazE/SpoVT family DNA-binding domain-containing protein [Corynebacterium casei]